MGNYIFLVLVLASFFGLSKLFAKAGVEGWKAWVPVYNFFILSKLLHKPWWWCLIMIVPGVNIIMYGVYGFNTARAFNKPSNSDLWFASFLPYIFFVKIGMDPTAKFVGLDKFKKEPSSTIKNWVDPIVFAIIAASIIRGYFIEAFTIPTSSLEKSLMVGDFLFVNKFAYGPKIPQTPLSFPFAHHSFPGTKSRSYLEWIKLPYYRLPGFGHVENNDIVVFNYPDGDTVLLNFQDRSYYQVLRDLTEDMKQKGTQFDSSRSNKYYESMARQYLNDPNNALGESRVGKIDARPVDKREHYVKRCVAIAGNTLQIKDGEVFIDDKLQATPEKAQHYYYVATNNALFGDIVQSRVPDISGNFFPTLSNQTLLDELDIYADEAVRRELIKNGDTTTYFLNMPVDVAAKVKAMPGVLSVKKFVEAKGEFDSRIFPHHSTFAWNNDNFGPLVIPKEGLTVPIDTHNVYLYEKVMNTYDDGIHQVEVKGKDVLYDGKPITSYTFKQDYYFMMGDNRHNSADSRSWGLVPYDHIVGSPFFVWLSIKYSDKNQVSGKSFLSSGKYRWDRFLSYVDDGKLHSIKIPFLVAVFGIWGVTRWNRLRKEKMKPKAKGAK
jgi:signal peptidase I